MMLLSFPPTPEHGSRPLWLCSPLPFSSFNSDLILKDQKCVRTITSYHPLKGKKINHTVLINTNPCSPIEVFQLVSGVRGLKSLLKGVKRKHIYKLGKNDYFRRSLLKKLRLPYYQQLILYHFEFPSWDACEDFKAQKSN